MVYTINSADNRYYDFVLNPDNYRRKDFSKTFAITIDIFSKTVYIALIGDFFSYDVNCAVIDGEILTVMQNDTLTQLNVLTGELLTHKHVECFGSNIGLYKVKSGYIIHGEVEILMLNENFDVIWRFSGNDIFISSSDKTSFELCESSIKLYDFNDECYEIDFNGKSII